MREEDIVARLRVQPFRPLRFHLSDERTFEVHERSHAYVMRGCVMIGLKPDGDGIPRTMERLNPREVARITLIDEDQQELSKDDGIGG